MATPKKKTSQSRSRSRRANNSKIAAPSLQACSHCKAFIPPHKVCNYCGYYKGKLAIDWAS